MKKNKFCSLSCSATSAKALTCYWCLLGRHHEYDLAISNKVKQLSDGSSLRLPFLPRSEWKSLLRRRHWCLASFEYYSRSNGVWRCYCFQTIMQRLICMMVMVLWSRPISSWFVKKNIEYQEIKSFAGHENGSIEVAQKYSWERISRG